MRFTQGILNGAVGAMNFGGRVLQRVGVERPRLEFELLLNAARARSTEVPEDAS